MYDNVITTTAVDYIIMLHSDMERAYNKLVQKTSDQCDLPRGVVDMHIIIIYYQYIIIIDKKKQVFIL